jgi:hypothetical protein
MPSEAVLTPGSSGAAGRKKRYRAPRSLASTTAAQAQQSYGEHFDYLSIVEPLSSENTGRGRDVVARRTRFDPRRA